MMCISPTLSSFLSNYFLHINNSFHPSQMLTKAFTAILAVILEAFGVYCEGEFKAGCG